HARPHRATGCRLRPCPVRVRVRRGFPGDPEVARGADKTRAFLSSGPSLLLGYPGQAIFTPGAVGYRVEARGVTHATRRVDQIAACRPLYGGVPSEGGGGDGPWSAVGRVLPDGSHVQPSPTLSMPKGVPRCPPSPATRSHTSPGFPG